MPSPALADWTSLGLARLDELEAVHTGVTGRRPGRRWGTEQLNRSLFVVLVAQFQTYCRDLHDAAVEVEIAVAHPQQTTVLRTLLVQGRKLDTQTPRAAALGSDFGRLGFDLVAALKAEGTVTQQALAQLDVLVNFRNAIGHGNETEIRALVSTGQIAGTKQSYRRYRRVLEALAHTMDRVVGAKLASSLQIPAPW